MKLWIDDVRPAPSGYISCKSTNVAKRIIELQELEGEPITLIDVDHDAGVYAKDGGDYIRLLDWLEETSRDYPIRIHSANPVGRENMRRIIRRNGWKEVF